MLANPRVQIRLAILALGAVLTILSTIVDVPVLWWVGVAVATVGLGALVWLAIPAKQYAAVGVAIAAVIGLLSGINGYRVNPDQHFGWAGPTVIGVAGEKAITAVGTTLTGRNVFTGKKSWTATLPAPASYAIARKGTLIALTGSDWVGLDGKTGKQLWTHPAETGDRLVTFGENIAVVSNTDRSVAWSALDGRQIWTRPVPVTTRSDSAVELGADLPYVAFEANGKWHVLRVTTNRSTMEFTSPVPWMFTKTHMIGNSHGLWSGTPLATHGQGHWEREHLGALPPVSMKRVLFPAKGGNEVVVTSMKSGKQRHITTPKGWRATKGFAASESYVLVRKGDRYGVWYIDGEHVDVLPATYPKNAKYVATEGHLAVSGTGENAIGRIYPFVRLYNHDVVMDHRVQASSPLVAFGHWVYVGDRFAQF